MLRSLFVEAQAHLQVCHLAFLHGATGWAMSESPRLVRLLPRSHPTERRGAQSRNVRPSVALGAPTPRSSLASGDRHFPFRWQARRGTCRCGRVVPVQQGGLLAEAQAEVYNADDNKPAAAEGSVQDDRGLGAGNVGERKGQTLEEVAKTISYGSAFKIADGLNNEQFVMLARGVVGPRAADYLIKASAEGQMFSRAEASTERRSV